jgi:hypothetical protein
MMIRSERVRAQVKIAYQETWSRLEVEQKLYNPQEPVQVRTGLGSVPSEELGDD